MTPLIVLCEFTGEIAEAMRRRGLLAWSCDILPGERLNGHIRGDALAVLKRGCPQDASPWRGAGLHWPCTWFTNAGVKWMYIGGHSRNGLDPARRAAMEESADGVCRILNTLLEMGIPFWFENPVMHGHAFEAIVRRCEWFSVAEMCSIQPWNLGVWETKRTCLWLHKLPPLVPKYMTIDDCRVALGLPKMVWDEKKKAMVVNKPHAKVHRMAPGDNRSQERSRTLPELAQAIADQWGPIIANSK